MKTKLLILFLLCFEGFSQKPRLHLIIAADVEDNAYTVRNFTKEEKVLNMYNLISRELNFDLQTKYLHASNVDFNAKSTLDYLGNIKVFTKDDIVVFYYIGRGFYPNRSTKFPLLEFQDTKNMLSVEQIRKNLSPIKSRLTLVVADCDESYTLANPRTLPHSLIRTGSVNHESDVFEKVLLASVGNEFNSLDSSRELQIKYDEESIMPNEDSLYIQTCLSGIEIILANNNNHKLEVDRLKQIALISKIISEYPAIGYPKEFDNYKKADLKYTLKLRDNKYQTEKFKSEDYKLLVDSLFLKRKVLDFDDSLNISIRRLFEYDKRPIIPEDWEYSNVESIDYFFEINNQINSKIARINLQKPINADEKQAFAIYKRLEYYKKDYLPSIGPFSALERKSDFDKLPVVSNTIFKTIDFRNEDYDVIIDSMFIKRSLLDKKDTLSKLLDKYIEFEARPLKRPIEFLSIEAVDKYYDNLDQLEHFLALPFKNNQDSISKIKLKYFFDRLNAYAKIGFPNNDLILKNIPTQRDLDIENITDVLYNKDQLFKFDIPLQLKLDSVIDETLTIHTVSLNKNDWAYYLYSKKSLESLRKSNDTSIQDTLLIDIAIRRLQEYPRSGFPNDQKKLKEEIENVGNNTFSYGKNESEERIREGFYGVIIDSLYKNMYLMNLSHPLYYSLDSLIIRKLPKGYKLEASILVDDNTTKPIIMQLFLSECGSIEMANGHQKRLNKNQYLEDYTDFVYNNFNKILRNQNFNKIGDLSLKNVYAPKSNKFIYFYQKSIPKTCSMISNSFVLPDFSKVPTTEKVNEMFEEYIKTNDLRKKKVLKTEITGYFENNAMLKVKPKSISPSVRTRPANISIDDYFIKLDKQTPKVDSLNIREGSVKRNQSFSKITTMMLVEK